ncbi:oligopeptide/dipeptide ABC transporter ATP-binding protein [Streptomyces sp. NBC_01589]|uniref:oligopeptide/dipeptide ABC transporter ATP-binding protein n=1 Tax=unclassified Streptomyces TaxID=2593676 RepID=UPI00386C906C
MIQEPIDPSAEQFTHHDALAEPWPAVPCLVHLAGSSDPAGPGTARRAFPTIGDPASRFAPSGLPGDPPDVSALGAGCAFVPRCVHAVDACRTKAVELWPAGDRRSAACLRVLDAHTPVTEGSQA